MSEAVRKGKRNNNNPQRETTSRAQEGKQGKQEQRGQGKDKKQDNKDKKDKKKGKHRSKRRKTEANTQQVFYPPNYTRAQKPHNPSKAPKQHKPTPNPQNPLKTPLKREIKAYSSIAHHKQSDKADKRQGAHRQRTTANLRQVLEVLRAGKPEPVDTPNGRQAEPQPAPTLHTHFKNILGFCPLLSPKIPTKHQGNPNKI